MLNDQKNIDFLSDNNVLLFFLCDLIGNRTLKINDLKIIYSHLHGKRLQSISEVVNYCKQFNWIEISGDEVSVVPETKHYLKKRNHLNTWLIESTINYLFQKNIFRDNMFTYDVVHSCIRFKSELLPLHYSDIRNMLQNQGFFIVSENTRVRNFYVNSSYTAFVSKKCVNYRKSQSLNQLKVKLLENEKIGEQAEMFVYEYEKKRLGFSSANKVKIISSIDVSAGYDIISFNTEHSSKADRFIEVKAVTDRLEFYWSNNEYETAKLLGEQYFLYLVSLSKIQDKNYTPEIIQNPAEKIMGSDNWLINPHSYFIRKIENL